MIQPNRFKRNLAASAVAIDKPLLVIGVALLVAAAASASATTTTTTTASLQAASTLMPVDSTTRLLSEDQQLARLEQPRQSFRIHMLEQTGGRKSLRTKAEHSSSRRRSVSTDAQQVVVAPSISGATLKKLLGQVAKQANLSATTTIDQQQQVANSNKKAPYFKFVSIHKASNNKQHAQALPSSSSSQANANSTSLAASISKQLADSLLYSASSLLLDKAASNGNSSLSLSSLASQLVAKATTRTPVASELDGGRVITGSIKSAKDNTSETDKKTAGDETREVSSLGAVERLGTTLGAISTIAKASGAGSIDSSNAIHHNTGKQPQQQQHRKKRPPGPSKIYNLPVQFVSNGQPSIVVFHTIRQHLANMKRLRTSMQEPQTHSAAQRGSKGTKKGPLKLKTNSRLIYLPLRYLNNGKASSVSFIKSPSVASRGHNSRASSTTTSTAATTRAS